MVDIVHCAHQLVKVGTKLLNPDPNARFLVVAFAHADRGAYGYVAVYNIQTVKHEVGTT